MNRNEVPMTIANPNVQLHHVPPVYRSGVPTSKTSTNVGLIVLIIAAACLFGGVVVVNVAATVIASGREADMRSARSDVETIYKVAEDYRVDHPNESCPTVEVLQAKNALRGGSKVTDPWKRPYRIFCNGAEVGVVSQGPDETLNTSDDIRVPSSFIVVDAK